MLNLISNDIAPVNLDDSKALAATAKLEKGIRNIKAKAVSDGIASVQDIVYTGFNAEEILAGMAMDYKPLVIAARNKIIEIDAEVKRVVSKLNEDLEAAAKNINALRKAPELFAEGRDGANAKLTLNITYLPRHEEYVAMVMSVGNELLEKLKGDRLVAIQDFDRLELLAAK